MTDYKQLGSDLGELLEKKQAAYGDVFSVTPAIIGLLFPDGIPVLAYRDVLTIVRVLDKIGRICTAAGRGDPMGEDPYRDIAGYAMLALGQREEQQQQDDLDTEAYLATNAPEPSDTVDDEPEDAAGIAQPTKRFQVWYGGKLGSSVWGEFNTREAADLCVDGLRKAYKNHTFEVVDTSPDATEEKAPSNDWAVTWASDKYGPYIEAVFSTRGQAEERCGEKRARMPGLTWRVCRMDEVGV